MLFRLAFCHFLLALQQIQLLPIKFCESFLALVKDGLLGLKDRSALLKGCYNIDILADLALFNQRQQPLVKFIRFDCVFLAERVESDFLGKDIGAAFAKSRFDDRLVSHRSPRVIDEFARLQLLEGAPKLRHLSLHRAVVQKTNIAIVRNAFGFFAALRGSVVLELRPFRTDDGEERRIGDLLCEIDHLRDGGGTSAMT